MSEVKREPVEEVTAGPSQEQLMPSTSSGGGVEEKTASDIEHDD